MKITPEIKEKVMYFMRILRDMEVDRYTNEVIVTLLQTEEQMDKVVEYIKENTQATQAEIFKKVEEVIKNDNNTRE